MENAVCMLEKNKNDLEFKWLTFWIGEQLFGVSIVGVEQIVSMQPVTEIPEYPAYAKGIINMRGATIPVIDLRLRIGKQEIEYTDQTCIIIHSVNEEELGFIVDKLDAVIDIPCDVVSPLPKMGADDANKYLMGVARIKNDDMKETVVLCLDASKILSIEEI